jgi:hypothetical protein
MIEAPAFATFCEEILGEPISKAWVTFFAAVEGLPLDAEGVELFCQCTGRSAYVQQVHVEATGICGRRSEKSSSAIKFLLWRALFAGYETQVRRSWFKRLGRHTERLRFVLIAQDMRVAGDAKRTAEALCLGSPVVSREIAEILANELVFKNGVSLICLPASKASVRGMTVPCCLIDEMAFISIEGADDKELLRSIRPSMLQFAQTRRLLKMTTPWMRSGIAYSEFSQRAERPDLLVWQASTETMTPRISHEELERERTNDPTYYEREYMARFVSDLETFLPWPDIHAAVQHWTERPPEPEPFYIAALDASGLTGGDTFTFGIGHSADAGFVVDVLRGWRRAAVPQVCDEISSVCKAFRVRNVIADQFAFTFLSELLRQRDIGLDQLTFSARSKPELFFDLKNMLAQGKIQLPDNPEMIRELRALESTRTSGGNYKICAPRGMHDDYVTVLAILSNKVKRSKQKFFMPEVLTINIGPGAGAPPGKWIDPHAGLAPDDSGDERFWRKVN